MIRLALVAAAAATLLSLPVCAAEGAAAKADAPGTTVVGDGETPLGLDFTPWQRANRDDLERAPLLLDGRADAASPSALREQMRDYMAIHAAHRVDME